MKSNRTMIVLLALAGSALWVSSSAGKPPAPAASLKDRMIGTWKLESRVTKTPDGTVTPLAGWDGAVGYIAYDKTGFMTVQFMQLNRTKESGTSAYTAYFGPYTVDESTGIVTHHIIGDINPMGVGGHQPRKVVMEGDDKLSLYISNGNSPNININSFSRMK